MRKPTALLLLSVLALACVSGRDTDPRDTDPRDTDPLDTDTGDTDTGDAVLDGYYRFLASQQDPATGLLASFVPHDDLPEGFETYLRNGKPAFTYDNALATIAWLARGQTDDVQRASTVLDTLVSVQRVDGSIPDVLHASTLAHGTETSTGNQAWALLALLSGYERTADPRYLLAAERLAAYLLDPATGLRNPAGFGGFRVGTGITGVSTEHNLDLAAGLSRLATALPSTAAILDPVEVRAAATEARLQATSQHDPYRGLVWTGTRGDGYTTNTAPVPLDTQTWSILALGGPASALDWTVQPAPEGLWTGSVACPDVRGPAFSTTGTAELWTEGLAQAHAAARLLGQTERASTFSDDLARLQATAPYTDGNGLVAACTTLQTGYGGDYFNSLGVGPTAWAALARQGTDPFWFRALDDGLVGHPLAEVPTVIVDVSDGPLVTCRGTLPCRFTATGQSTGVHGTSRRIHLLVQPTAPIKVDRFFTQSVPAEVAPDGSWTAEGQLGDGVSPVSPGDRLRLVVLVVDGAPPPLQLPLVSPATVPGVLAVSGVAEGEAR